MVILKNKIILTCLILIFNNYFAYSQDIEINYKILELEFDKSLQIEFEFKNKLPNSVYFNACLSPSIWNGKYLPVVLYIYDKSGKKIRPAVAKSLTIISETDKKSKCYHEISPEKSYSIIIDLYKDYKLEKNVFSDSIVVGFEILYDFKNKGKAEKRIYSNDLYQINFKKNSIKRM